MVWDWLTERGPQTRYYGASAAMTRDPMHDEGVEQAREQFYASGDTSYAYRFTRPEQPIREALQWARGEDKTGVGSVLGSYTVYIQNKGDGTIAIYVHNIVGRESATRLLGWGPSVEDTVASGQIIENSKPLIQELQKLVFGKSTLARVRQKWPRSVLNNTRRGQSSTTGLVPGVWGGNMETWFMWTEPLRASYNK